MNTELLEKTARALVAPGKGILAADESSASCQKRFDAVGVECTSATRREYREILIETPGNEAHLSGIIFYDETFWQLNGAGMPLRESAATRGIIPGIKLDLGLIDLPDAQGEKLSQGLDDLPERAQKYVTAGAKFAKWRSVIVIGDELPTMYAITANAKVLAKYAKICQEAGLVPIVEPEVLFDGTHDAARCEEVMEKVYDALFAALREEGAHLPGAVLKTAMVLPGKESGIAIDAADVAERTARVFLGHIPKELGGVVFLSGGQTSDDAMRNLAVIAAKGPYPWGITFSYSRALQDPVLKYWAEHRGDKAGAQKIFGEMLARASAAAGGSMWRGRGEEFVSAGQDL